MNKFYNPKLYKPPPTTEAPAFAQVAPPPPPETFGAYAKKGGESGGVIAMMDTMIADLDKEMHFFVKVSDHGIHHGNDAATFSTLLGIGAKCLWWWWRSNLRKSWCLCGRWWLVQLRVVELVHAVLCKGNDVLRRLITGECVLSLRMLLLALLRRLGNLLVQCLDSISKCFDLLREGRNGLLCISDCLAEV